MSDQNVAIIDSGICNLFNIRRAFHSLGAEVLITRSEKDIEGASRLVLPGVGAFGAGMKSLYDHHLVEPIRTYIKTGKPFLGICLGMQMLLSHSEEYGLWDGLDIIKGKVRIFAPPVSGMASYKIPQIGWNYLEPNGNWQQTPLNGLGEKPYFYFVHSYIVVPDNITDCLAHTTYGRDRYCSVVRRNNITACQFHPERSGEVGLKLLRNFLSED